jgi:hypothetical protein
MREWSVKRRVSFFIHTTIVAVPFSFSTASAGAFWYGLFGSWWVAAPMVAIIDVLALLGLALYVVRIESPFVHLRHALPFISIIPLGLELYGLLKQNDASVPGLIAVVATIVLVWVARQCFTTIERLFIPPIEAAREKAREQMDRVSLELARLKVLQEAADTFARERLSYHAPTTITTVPDERSGTITALSKTARVKALAAERGESVSTVWRKVNKGEIVIEE